MEKATVNLFELKGSSYEIGYQLGKNMMVNPQLMQMQKNSTEMFSDTISGLVELLVSVNIKRMQIQQTI